MMLSYVSTIELRRGRVLLCLLETLKTLGRRFGDSSVGIQDLRIASRAFIVGVGKLAFH